MTLWTRQCAEGEDAEPLVVHTPEEAVVAVRVAGEWLATCHTGTAAAVLLRKRWTQVHAQRKRKAVR